jgi:hypothetical protein
MDNQKPGLHPKLTHFLRDSAGKSWVQIKRFTVMYDYESVKARKTRVRGVGTINQTETVLMATVEPMALPVRAQSVYTGFNTGSVISPVKLQPYPMRFSMTFGETKAVYGKARMPVGGKGEDNSSDASSAEADPNVEIDAPPSIEVPQSNAEGSTIAMQKAIGPSRLQRGAIDLQQHPL